MRKQFDAQTVRSLQEANEDGPLDMQEGKRDDYLIQQRALRAVH